MLEIILIFCLVILILTFFYKQAVCEFRINQIEWAQKDTIGKLLGEKIPLVVRGIPSASFWSHQDVSVRPVYNNIPIFKDLGLSDWLQSTPPYTLCPWSYSQAETIAKVSGINVWATKWINSFIINPLMKFWMKPYYHCWAGNIGLRKTYATWTCLFPVDGEINVTIMPENSESVLPAAWKNCFPGTLTTSDTPFVADIKFIDIILRPGNCLFMPAHWFVSWTGTDKSEKPVMACTISYHTPISYMAFKMGTRTD
jgi:hypothetical protein